MEEGRFKSAQVGISRGAGVRVIVGDKTGYAYTDEVSEAKLLRAAEVASYIAKDGKPVKPVDVKDARRPSFVTVKLPLNDVADAEAAGRDAPRQRRRARLRLAHQDGVDQLLRRGPRPGHRHERGRVHHRRASAAVLHRPDAERGQRHAAHGARAPEPPLRLRDVRRGEARGRGPGVRPRVDRDAGGQGRARPAGWTS